MKDYDIPLVDEENPLYCPSLPAVSFLESIRRQLHENRGTSRENTPELSPDHEDHYLLPSFTRLLDKSLTEDDLLELRYNPGQPKTLLGDDSGDTSVGSILQSAMFRGFGSSASYVASVSDSVSKQDECSTSFSDLLGPAKRERSLLSVNENSFELSGKADRIQYFARGSSPSDEHIRRFPLVHALGNGWRARADELQEKISRLEDELYGIAVGTETPRGIKSLISRLDNLLPGIRLRDMLTKAANHQDLVDTLCSNGFVNTRVLNAFRTSEIEFLDLTASLADEGGLNMDAHNLLQVLAKPNSFLFLHEINLSGTTLRDSNITYLHHLPRLARLWLQGTGVTNEAVFLLLPLKRSLQELDVAYNPEIDDDAVTAFNMLPRLAYLTFLGTHITITGVRRLTGQLKQHSRVLDLEVPASCEEYLRQLHRKYIPHPSPPLITDPKAVQNLTTAAVSHNLAAHAAVNPDIPTHGSEAFLVKQLEELLENRQADLYARDLIKLD